LKTEFGQEIDAHDAVFRDNEAPVNKVNMLHCLSNISELKLCKQACFRYTIVGLLFPRSLDSYITSLFFFYFLSSAPHFLSYELSKSCADKFYFQVSMWHSHWLLISVMFSSAEICKTCWIEKRLSTGCPGCCSKYGTNTEGLL
jgi:hypothetical protein